VTHALSRVTACGQAEDGQDLSSRPVILPLGRVLPVAGRDPELEKKLLKQLRLWLFSLVCASIGAATIWATDSLGIGVLAFLASVVLLGPLLWLYEKRRR
jgi:hypothetical protein